MKTTSRLRDWLPRFLLLASFALASGPAVAAAAPKVRICHFPPGNPANVQLLTVGAAAVPAHLTQHSDAACAAGASDCCFRGGSAPSRCTDFRSDPNNCGSCGNVCAPGTTCSGGVCSCPAGTLLCNGACVDPGTDPANCGACGTACAGDTTCSGGACVCPAGSLLCDGACVDPTTDPANCGACGTACATGGTCDSGQCTCPEGGTACGGRRPGVPFSGGRRRRRRVPLERLFVHRAQEMGVAQDLDAADLLDGSGVGRRGFLQGEGTGVQ